MRHLAEDIFALMFCAPKKDQIISTIKESELQTSNLLIEKCHPSINCLIVYFPLLVTMIMGRIEIHCLHPRPSYPLRPYSGPGTLIELIKF